MPLNKTIYTLLLVIIAGIFWSEKSIAQAQLVFEDDAFMVMDGGSEASPAYLVIENDDPDAITLLGSGGNLVSEDQYHIIRWNIGLNATGNYILPYTSDLGIKIPFELQLSGAGTGGDFIDFSTYGTPQDNTPLPIGVDNLIINGVPSNGDNVIDRFWKIDASSFTTRPDVTLNFGYKAAEQTGSIIPGASEMFAKRYNTTTDVWDYPSANFGIDNLVDEVTGVEVEGAELWPFWSLVICTPPPLADEVTATPNPLCVGEDATIDATGSGTNVIYNVYDAATGGTLLGTTPLQVSPTATTTYYVETVNQYDEFCVSENRVEVTITIQEEIEPVATATSVDVCQGETIELSVNTVPGATYEWEGPDGFTSTEQNPTIPIADVSNTGTYTVSFTSGNCVSSNSSSIEIEVTALPMADASADPREVCEGYDIQLFGNEVPGATYEWTGPGGFSSTEQNPLISPATIDNSGTYELTLTVNGCSSPFPSTTTVTVSPIPEAVASFDELEICEGEEIQLTAEEIPGAAYEWTGPDGFTSTEQNPTIPNATQENAGTYSLEVLLGICFSENTAETEVTIIEAPIASVEATSIDVCEGEDLELQATSLPGASYEWTGSNGFTSTEQNPIIPNAGLDDAGTYTVEVELDGCSSLSSAEVEVTVIESPVASVDDLSLDVCEGTTLTLEAEEVSGVTYDWTGPGGFTATGASVSIDDITTSNEGTYTISITTPDGCSSINPVEVEVTVLTAPTVDISITSTDVCYGETIAIEADEIIDATYEWTGPNGFISSDQNIEIESATSSESGTYSLVVNDGECSSIVPIEVTIEVHEIPTANFDITDGTIAYCDYETPDALEVNFTGNSPWQLTYEVNGDEVIIASNDPSTQIGNLPGTYTLTFIEDEYCNQTLNETITIEIITSPETPGTVLESDSVFYCLGDVNPITVNDTSDEATYYWFVDQNFDQVYQEGTVLDPISTEGDYEYTLIAEQNSCESLPYTIWVFINPCDIKIPTAFTPNGDGMNDAWEIPNLDILYPNHVLRIFNRWGALLYEHNATTQGAYNDNPWDGTHKGELLPLGSYLFILEYNDGSDGVFNGAVSILLEE